LIGTAVIAGVGSPLFLHDATPAGCGGASIGTAVAFLAGHPRIDLKPRAAALGEKDDIHRARPFVMT